MRFRHRLLLLILLPLPVLMLMISVLGYRHVDQRHIDLVQSRIGFILANLRTSIEAQLSLGLRLDQIAITQTLLERERAGDSAIRAIDVFDNAGNVLFSTDRGALGEPVADSWQQAGVQDSDGWWLQERGDVVFGLRLENDLGATVGSIAVTVTVAERAQHSVEMLRFIVPLALGVTVLAGLFGWLLVARLSRSAIRPFDRVVQQLTDGTATDSIDPLSQQAAAARATATTTLAALDKADHELQTIDASD